MNCWPWCARCERRAPAPFLALAAWLVTGALHAQPPSQLPSPPQPQPHQQPQPPALAADCPAPPPGAQTIGQAPLRVHWTAEPAPIAVSRPFALRLGLCPVRAELLRVDARMPEHRHGMNYRVSLAREGDEWLARGMVWHMPGHWELLLVLRLDGVEHRLVQSVTLR